MQRLRITFARDGAAKYLSHLDMMRAWERACRRAGWILSYSHGFNPHPEISFASPLPVGVSAEADLVDVALEEPLDPATAYQALSSQMPAGIEIRAVEELPPDSRTAQRYLRAVEYLAVCPGAARDLLAAGIERLTGAESLPRRRGKPGQAREYDLRPLVLRLVVEEVQQSGTPAVRMTLRSDSSGAGRADEILREIGLDPAECLITRTRLILEGSA